MTRTHPHPRTRRALLCACLAPAIAIAALVRSAPAEAFIYTVGASGTNNNCSFPTIQEALDKAASTTEDDEIWITRDVAEGWYRSQALVANDADEVPQGGPGGLRLVGGFDDCWDVTPEGMTELDGNGGVSAPVLRIDGYHVRIEGLRFTRGDATGRSGGGIAYKGAGHLTIIGSMIDNNDAQRGGGIAFTGTSGNPRLWLEDSLVSDNRAEQVGGGILLVSQVGQTVMETWNDVSITGNSAGEDGGGIAMGGNTFLSMRSAVGSGEGVQVADNFTPGNGGGILAVPPVTMRLTSATRSGTSGTFSGNVASTRGGGIAIMSQPRLGTAQGDSSVVIGSEDIDNPFQFAFNDGGALGGAIFARVRSPEVANVDVCSWNAGFQLNQARDGAAVYVVGSGVRYRNDPECRAGPRQCPAGGICNLVFGNWGSLPDDGGTIFKVTDGAHMRLDSMRLLDNDAIGYSLVAASQTAGVVAPILEMDNLLVAGNRARALVETCADNCLSRIDSTTFTHNQLSEAAFRVGSPLFYVRDTIIDQPDDSLGIVPFAADAFTRVLSNAFAPAGMPGLIEGTPVFVDAEALDYRLDGSSPGVDMAPWRGGFDALGRTRSVDIPWREDGEGWLDLGAIETQLDEVPKEDLIFANHFELN